MNAGWPSGWDAGIPGIESLAPIIFLGLSNPLLHTYPKYTIAIFRIVCHLTVALFLIIYITVSDFLGIRLFDDNMLGFQLSDAVSWLRIITIRSRKDVAVNLSCKKISISLLYRKLRRIQHDFSATCGPVFGDVCSMLPLRSTAWCVSGYVPGGAQR